MKKGGLKMISKFYYNQDTLGEDLKQMRRICNMTQREVANEIKVTRNAIINKRSYK